MQPKNQFIQLDDWFRILFGATSPNFLIEVLFRAFFVYLILLLAMRLMGKRMANQLSRNEMAALVSLAAAIGVPLLDAHRGLLAALVIALVIIGIERLVARLVIGHPGFEALTQGTPSVLVENGVMQRDEMRQTLVTRERLFAQLRSNSLEHLGQVKRFILEPSGTFTLIEAPEPTPGLAVLPTWDSEFTPQKSHPTDQQVCYHCGNPRQHPADQQATCRNCGKAQWVQALG